MSKNKIVVAILIVTLMCIGAFTFAACKKKELYIDTSVLKVEMFDDYYIGLTPFNGNNAFDLSTKFKDSTFALGGETSCATLLGATLIPSLVGEFKLNVTSQGKTVKKNIFIIEGVNVYNNEQFENVIETRKTSAIIHDNIVLTGNIDIGSNIAIYGNGNLINAEAVTKPSTKKGWGGDALSANGENITIQDIHIMGLDMSTWSLEQKRTFDIGNLERFGSLIAYRSDDFYGHKVGGVIKNVVAENGHSLVSLTGSSVLVEGSMFKNAADSHISVETKSNGGTKLKVKNNVFINAVVSAILCWGYTKANGYLDLTTEGFMDVYNWKDSSTTKIMPNSESLAGMVNGLVASELGKKKNAVFMYNMGDKKYIHVAIIVIATTGLKSNNAKVNGVVLSEKAGDSSSAIPSTDNYVLRKLPGATLANTACIVGYGNNGESKSIKISPSTKLDLDKIYTELRNGRN